MANSTTTTTSGINPEFMPYYSALFNQAQRNIFTTDPTGKITGQQQFKPYEGPTVAGFTPQQLAVQQQVANMQTPQSFADSRAGLNQAVHKALTASDQGMNQAFSYRAQAPQNLAIGPTRWGVSGANPPPSQQAYQQARQQPPLPMQNQSFGPMGVPPQTQQQMPQMGNIAQMLQQYFQQQGQQQRPAIQQQQPLDNGNGGFGPAQPQIQQPPPQGLNPPYTPPSLQPQQPQPHVQPPNNGNGGFGPAQPQLPQQPALTGAAAYNAEFSRLNPGIPINRKWDAAGQQKYIQDLLARQQATGGTAYTAPQGFAVGGPVTGYKSNLGLVTPPTTTTAPISTFIPPTTTTTPIATSAPTTTTSTTGYKTSPYATPTTTTTAPTSTFVPPTTTTSTQASTPAPTTTTTGYKTSPYVAPTTPTSTTAASAFQTGMGVNNTGGQLTFAPSTAPTAPSTFSPTAVTDLIAQRQATQAANPTTSANAPAATAPPQTNPATTNATATQALSPFQQGMGMSVDANGLLTFAGSTAPVGAEPTDLTPMQDVQRRIDMRDNPTAGNPFQNPSPFHFPEQAQPDNGNGGFGPPGQTLDEYGQPDISQYESRYQQGVTDVALKQAQKQSDLQRQQNAMGSIGRGTFGGARQALIQSEGDYNTAQNMANIQAMGSQAGLQNAQTQFNADRASNMQRELANQQVGLSQQQMAQQGEQFQAGLGRDLGLGGLNAGIGASTNLGQLGSQQQQSELARLQAQGLSAAQAQALQQQQNDIAMQNYYRAQQYPMQQLGQYSDLLRGNQAGMGTVGTSTTPGGSNAGQIVGAIGAGLGIYGQNREAINSGIGGLYDTFFG